MNINPIQGIGLPDATERNLRKAMWSYVVWSHCEFMGEKLEVIISEIDYILFRMYGGHDGYGGGDGYDAKAARKHAAEIRKELQALYVEKMRQGDKMFPLYDEDKKRAPEASTTDITDEMLVLEPYEGKKTP